MLNEESIPLIFDALEKYPLSQPQDIVKLLYQREFGPAHAVANPEAAKRFLLGEYSSTIQEEGVLCEYIGGGYARLLLSRLDANGVTPEEAAELFVKSAAPAGDKSAFAEMLLELARDPFIAGLMPGLPGYIADHVAAGCPAVHHSERYRAAYAPAYRVIRAELLAKRII